MCFQSLNNMIPAIRKIQFGLPKSGNTKVCHAKRFIDMSMWTPTTAWTLFSVIRQTPK